MALERATKRARSRRCARRASWPRKTRTLHSPYGHVLALGGRREPALDEVRRVLAANEQSARGWYLLAWLLRDADPAELREAHAAAQRSLALADDNRTRALAAALDMRAGRFAAAEVAYQALSAAEPDNADYRYWLAMAQLGKGDCAARAGLADALELRPSWGEAHLALARVEAICGAAEAARRRALALFKARDDVDTRLTLAIASSPPATSPGQTSSPAPNCRMRTRRWC